MRWNLVIVVLLGCCSVATAGASNDAADELAARRGTFKAALALAESGPPSAGRAAAQALADHPLYPYLVYALMRRDLDAVSPQRLQEYLDAHAALPVAERLRVAWLADRVRDRRWDDVRAFYRDDEAQTLRCGWLSARAAAGVDEALLEEIAAQWLRGHSLPAECDPAFAALERAGRLTPVLRRERIALAAEEGNAGLMRYLARGLPDGEARRARAYADFIDQPTVAARAWHANPTSQRVAVAGLRQLARRDADAAHDLLTALRDPLQLDAAARADVAYDIALWSAASYEPQASARFDEVPASRWDDRLHGWHVREALARGSDGDARDALAAMPDALARDTRWRYLDARLSERAGQRERAQSLYAEVAREATYHGFLAADRLGTPYALCPIEPSDDAALRARVAANPALRRAIELQAIDRLGWALDEWQLAIQPMDAHERRVAVALAVDAGWIDRAVFTLNEGEDLRAYRLRFPLAHGGHLEREATRRGVDPAWMAALIRAESAWIPTARSHADARGLMQLLPGTGRQLARELGVTWAGASTLYQPLTNITLGAAYLREMLDRFALPVVATAAYNAGPTPASRWRSERAPREPDVWIETIPYHETRDYVARIFAFSVIYDWRLSGSAVPLSARMSGDRVSDRDRRGFHCPTTTRLAGSAP